MDFPAFLFFVGVVTPDGAVDGEGCGAGCARAVESAELVGFFGFVVGVDGEVVAGSRRTGEEVVADHVAAVGGPAAGHCDGDFSCVAEGRVVELAVGGPLAGPGVENF